MWEKYKVSLKKINKMWISWKSCLRQTQHLINWWSTILTQEWLRNLKHSIQGCKKRRNCRFQIQHQASNHLETHSLFHQISSAEQPQIYATHLTLKEIKDSDCQTIIQYITSLRILEHRKKMSRGPLNFSASQDVLFILRAGKLLIILQLVD